MRSATLVAAAASAALTFAAVPAFAAWHCTIHPPQGASSAKLRSMARISKSRAEKIALRHVEHAAQISEAEIEGEQDCLIWSFDVKQHGRKGIEEVNIDAGNGRVLGTHHESASEEAREPD
jgi:Peptidase propeptide and YPEB domain